MNATMWFESLYCFKTELLIYNHLVFSPKNVISKAHCKEFQRRFKYSDLLDFISHNAYHKTLIIEIVGFSPLVENICSLS